MSTDISDSDILAAFKINYSQFLSFLPDTLYTVNKYGPEIREFAKDLKVCEKYNKKIILPDTSRHWKKLGGYQLRTEEIEMVVGDCLLMAVATAMGITETDMLNSHIPGYMPRP